MGGRGRRRETEEEEMERWEKKKERERCEDLEKASDEIRLLIAEWGKRYVVNLENKGQRKCVCP